MTFLLALYCKKTEAREKDIAGAVDFVLTFQEAQDIFKIMELNPEMKESEKDPPPMPDESMHTGGVSEARAALQN